MQGFVQSGGEETMACFAARAAPVLQELAQTFVVCNRWFSSLPGPTWPNRFFVHAGSSGGLTNSPSAFTSLKAVTIASATFDFQNGSIYDLLDAAHLPWRVYHGDHFPQVLAVKRHVLPFVRGSTNFAWIRPGDRNDPFAAELNSGNYDAAYAFIEPDYNILSSMYSGNSQHPRGRVSSGEALIKYVYETIRNSPVWENSMLVVTYDEHGGFFDHVVPEPCIVPGDKPLNYTRAKNPYSFDFRRYGVRVPTVLISPWVDAVANSTVFDHASVLRTLADLFPHIRAPLTNLDGNASSLVPLLTRAAPRVSDADAPKHLSEIVQEVVAGASRPSDANSAPDPMLAGFTRIAASLDIALRQLSAPATAEVELEEIRLPEISVRTTGESLDYVHQVITRLQQFRSSIALR